MAADPEVGGDAERRIARDAIRPDEGWPGPPCLAWQEPGTMPNIHPTALVDRRAELAEGVSVGPYSLIGANVVIGEDTSVGAHTVIENRTQIGAGNRIGHHVALGQTPQDMKYQGESTSLIIGDRNEIREHVTMHIGTENGGGTTTLGSHCLVMVGSHIAHDSHIGNHCVLANNAVLAGHVTVHDHAVISGTTGVTHYVTVGRHAFIGGMAGVVHDCPPFMVCDGHPARVRALNVVGLNRHNFDRASIARLKRVYRASYGRRGRQRGDLFETLAALEAECRDDMHVMELLEFARRSSASANGRSAEDQRPDNKWAAPTK